MSNRRNRPPNRYGCKPDGDVCVAHDMPKINRHGCEKQVKPATVGVMVIKPDEVYVRSEKHRRVIDVRNGRVCYSRGGDTNMWRNLSTFSNWARHAKRTHDGQSAGT